MLSHFVVTHSHLAFAERSNLLCTGGVALLQLDAGTHLLTQPLVFHSNHLDREIQHLRSLMYYVIYV